jgi:hypothetical protein
MPVAVQPPVDPALQPITSRREPDRDDRRGQQAAPEPGPLAQQPFGKLDHRDVHTDPAGGQQPVHRRAADQIVQVKEPIPQDRDPGRQGTSTTQSASSEPKRNPLSVGISATKTKTAIPVSAAPYASQRNC